LWLGGWFSCWERLPTCAGTFRFLFYIDAALPSGGKPRSEDDIVALIGLTYRYALPLYEVSRGRYELEFNPAHAGLSPRIVW